jgi:hypothetical protein
MSIERVSNVCSASIFRDRIVSQFSVQCSAENLNEKASAMCEQWCGCKVIHSELISGAHVVTDDGT